MDANRVRPPALPLRPSPGRPPRTTRPDPTDRRHERPPVARAHPEAARRARRRARRHAGSLALARAWWPAAGGIAAAALLALLVVGLVRTGGEQIAPGVRVLDLPVGGLTRDEARARIGARVAALAAQPATVRLGGRAWAPALADLGVGYDVEATLDRAEAVDADRGAAGRLLDWLRPGTSERTVPLVARVDQTRFDAYLGGLEAEVGGPPVDAAVTIGPDGAVTATPGREGVLLDREAARGAAVAQVAALQPIVLDLAPVAHGPVVPDQAAVEAKAVLDRVLGDGLTLTSGDRDWWVAPAELAAAARVERVERAGAPSPGLAPTLDGAGLDALVTRIADEADGPPVDARVDDHGDHVELIPAEPGRAVRRAELAAAVLAAFAAGTTTVPIPADETPPAVSTASLLAELGVTTTLAEGVSGYAGSTPERLTNVVVAAELVDWTLIPPGGLFSYNTSLGGIVVEPGFVPADASEGGVVGQSLGGGVCQVSTTIFRAALLAGLPITEWWPHAYRMPYYEQGGWSAGLDASIAQTDEPPYQGTDLRFTNPTDGWLLIRVERTGEDELTARIEGPPTGWSVALDEAVYEGIEPAPPPTEVADATLAAGTTVEDQPAREGMTVTVVRHVLDADGVEIATDTFVSEYRPQGAVYRVGPEGAVAG